MNCRSCEEKSGGSGRRIRAGGAEHEGPSESPPYPHPLTYRKALYMGRYQQTKEQGVKRRTQRIESPKPEPLLVSTQKLARQAKKFRRRARVLPKGQRERTMGSPGLQ